MREPTPYPRALSASTSTPTSTFLQPPAVPLLTHFIRPTRHNGRRFAVGRSVARSFRHEREGRLAQPRQPFPGAADEVEQVRVRAPLEERGVEVVVQPGEQHGVEVAQQVAHLLVRPAGGGEVGRPQPGSGQRGREALEQSERLHRVDVPVLVDQRDAGADVVLEGDGSAGAGGFSSALLQTGRLLILHVIYKLT